MGRTPSPRAGFTLVEMMITVVILGILAAIATVGYRRYVARARTSEAVAMLAEIAARENTYYTEFAQFLPVDSKASAPVTPTLTSGTGAAVGFSSFFPVQTIASFDSVRVSTPLGTLPQSWNVMGIRPKDRGLYCNYFAYAGTAGTTAGPAGSFGLALLGSGAQTAQWFYALAACNLMKHSTEAWADASGGTTNTVTVLGLSSNRPTLVTFHDGK
jgi:prepilin-type N-terminal cleavage/methylation domain-containing protein